MARCKCVRCGTEYSCGCNAIHGLCPNCVADNSTGVLPSETIHVKMKFKVIDSEFTTNSEEVE